MLTENQDWLFPQQHRRYWLREALRWLTGQKQKQNRNRRKNEFLGKKWFRMYSATKLQLSVCNSNCGRSVFVGGFELYPRSTLIQC